ncbi:DUF2141 domain-containing protein [Aequorivita sediminis]|uniref:DUF2141 domain-containing protein n=1 Tax=Aequorivita sediminis TaxID=3073653 RepID=UPI0028AE2055|nr:DUF2141 domain-containing protein [Aequorivita sp. F6058]
MNYFLIFFYFFISQPQTDTFTLTITVDNIKEVNGTIEIGLFNNGDRFLEKGQAYKSISIAVNNSTETITVKNIPKGTYAISLFQDLNDDKICNQNFFGIPKEPYAFSNNIKPKFSAPTFEDCQFQLNSDKSVRISLLN